MTRRGSHDAPLSLLLALVVLGRWDQLRKALRRAAREGIPLAEVREILLQAHLFAGFPRAIEAFENLAAVQATGIFPAQSTPKSGETEEGARGKELFERIYGARAEEVRRRLASLHGDLERWVLEHAYGEVLSRPGLSTKQRELASVAALVVSRQWRQVLSHLRGALRLGADPGEIRAVFQELRPFAPPAVLAKARRLLEQA